MSNGRAKLWSELGGESALGSDAGGNLRRGAGGYVTCTAAADVA